MSRGLGVLQRGVCDVLYGAEGNKLPFGGEPLALGYPLLLRPYALLALLDGELGVPEFRPDDLYLLIEVPGGSRGLLILAPA